MSEITRKQHEDDILVENGSVRVVRNPRSTGEFSLRVEPITGGYANELVIYTNERGRAIDKLALLHEVVGDMLTELRKRGVRS